jgi:hypothetical protein
MGKNPQGFLTQNICAEGDQDEPRWAGGPEQLEAETEHHSAVERTRRVG